MGAERARAVFNYHIIFLNKFNLINNIHEKLAAAYYMAIDVGCEFRYRGSIPSVCHITDADLGQVG